MQESPSLHQHVRGTEAVANVSVGFAIEQIVEHTVDYLNRESEALARTEVVLLACGLILTVIRIYHGNVRFLSDTYGFVSRDERRSRVFAQSFSQNLDVLCHLAMYSLLVAAGHLIDRRNGPPFLWTAYSIVVMSLVDILWSIAQSRFASVRHDHRRARFLGSRLAIALLTLSILVFFARIDARTSLALLLPCVLFAGTIIDVAVNYRFHFIEMECLERNPGRWVLGTLVKRAMEVARAPLDMPPPRPQAVHSWSRSLVATRLRVLFHPLIEASRSERCQLFQSSSVGYDVQLAVDYYVPGQAGLARAFRYAGSGPPAESTWLPAGTTHADKAWEELDKGGTETIDRALLYDDRQIAPSPGPQGPAAQGDAWSAIFAPVFYPSTKPVGDRQIIGVIALIANRRDPFIQDVHGALFLNLASHLAKDLTRLFPEAAWTAPQVASAMAELGADALSGEMER